MEGEISLESLSDINYEEIDFINQEDKKKESEDI